MPRLALEDPQSFKIQKFLLTLQFEGGKVLSLINPGPDGSGKGPEIFHTLLNIPVIGLTFQPTPSRSNLGFIPPQETPEQKDDPRHSFDSEALLVLDTASIPLPKEFADTETWVIQVKDHGNERIYTQVGEAIMKQFGVNIVITSASMKRSQYVEDGSPVDPQHPRGPLWCPIGVTKIKLDSE